MKEEGKELTKDQLQAIDKLPEVSTQLDIVRELQKQFQQLQAEVWLVTNDTAAMMLLS